MAEVKGWLLTNLERRWRPESTICLGFFLAAICLTYSELIYFSEISTVPHIVAIALSSVIVLLQYYLLPSKVSEISVRSFLLGHVMGLGIFVANSGRPEWMFGVYLIFLAWFHWSEYLFASLFCRHSCSAKSFLLNHSPAYIVATLASWVEFAVIQLTRPGLRSFSFISVFGLLMCLMGEFLRKLAIATAAESFNHIVEESKRREHRLVTHGVYAFCRHPSYLGWWLFAVGTQALLQNPICAVAYFFGAQRFFADRVQYEEELLVDFFGDFYKKYQQRVPLGLPFIPDPAATN